MAPSCPERPGPAAMIRRPIIISTPPVSVNGPQAGLWGQFYILHYGAEVSLNARAPQR